MRSQHLGKVFDLRSAYQLFWAAMARRKFITDATVAAGTYSKQAPGGWSRRVWYGRGVKGR